MYLAFENFKEYLFGLNSKQILQNKKVYTQYADLQFITNVVNHMKVRPAGEKEKPLLQYGTFFDGQHLFYHEDIEVLDQNVFNQAMLNHVLHFILGAQFTLSYQPTSATLKWYMSNVALYFAHFNISGVQPRYGNSVRGSWYQKYHVKEKGYGLIFSPHPNTANYFWEQWEAGNIQLPKGFAVKRSNVFDCPEGIIYTMNTKLPYLTMRDGITFMNKETKQIAFFKEEDGSLQRTDFMNKRARELKGYKEVMELLGGELEDDLDDE